MTHSHRRATTREPGATARADEARPATSLHDRIVGDLRSRIVSGALAPGQRIPTEAELCAIFRCSRMTINKALSELSRAGLVERRRKAGSFVARQRTQSAVLQIQDVRTEVEALGFEYGHSIIDRAVRRAREADRTCLRVPATARLLAVSCLHTASGKPFCLEVRLVNLAEVPDAEHEAFATTAPGPWLVAHVPWSEARHVIRAVGADGDAARLLAIRRGTACMVMERWTWANGRPVTHVTFTYPGALRELVAEFHPAGA